MLNAAAIEDAVETTDLGFIERQLIKEALAVAERRETWQMHKCELAPVVNALRKLGADVSLSDSLDVRLVGDAKVLAAAVRILRTSGFGTGAKRPAKGDTTWTAFFKREGLALAVYFSFSSSVCRRVQVGTTMVEQPVFETVCDSIELPADVQTKALPTAQAVGAITDAEMPF